MAKIIDDDRARQGSLGRPVLYVLVFSLILAAIYLVTMTGWSGTSSVAPPKTQQTLPQGAAVPPEGTGSVKQADPTR